MFPLNTRSGSLCSLETLWHLAICGMYERELNARRSRNSSNGTVLERECPFDLLSFLPPVLSRLVLVQLAKEDADSAKLSGEDSWPRSTLSSMDVMASYELMSSHLSNVVASIELYPLCTAEWEQPWSPELEELVTDWENFKYENTHDGGVPYPVLAGILGSKAPSTSILKILSQMQGYGIHMWRWRRSGELLGWNGITWFGELEYDW